MKVILQRHQISHCNLMILFFLFLNKFLMNFVHMHKFADHSNQMFSSLFNSVLRKYLYHALSAFRSLYVSFILVALRYFPRSSTKEILDELYPKLYPLDTGKICGAFDLLSIFLNPLHGHELWLDDFMNLWDTYHNPSWNVVCRQHLAFCPLRHSFHHFAFGRIS